MRVDSLLIVVIPLFRPLFYLQPVLVGITLFPTDVKFLKDFLSRSHVESQIFQHSLYVVYGIKGH